MGGENKKKRHEKSRVKNTDKKMDKGDMDDLNTETKYVMSIQSYRKTNKRRIKHNTSQGRK